MDFDDDFLEDGKKYFWLNWRFSCLSKLTKFFHVSSRLRFLWVIVLCLLYWIRNNYNHNSIVQTVFKCLFYISVFLSASARKNWIIPGLRYTATKFRCKMFAYTRKIKRRVLMIVQGISQRIFQNITPMNKVRWFVDAN